MKTTRVWAAIAFSFIGFWIMPAIAQTGVKIKNLDHKFTSLNGGKVKAPEGGIGIIEDDTGTASGFRLGHGILQVPKGVDPQKHAAEAGLTLVQIQSPMSGKYFSAGKDPKDDKLLQLRRNDLFPEVLQRTALVKLPLSRANVATFLKKLEKEGARSKLKAASSQDALKTLAAIDAYREKWSSQGFRLVLDIILAPDQLLNTTSEAVTAYCGSHCGEALSDKYWDITNLRRAWHLAQVAKTPFEDPEQGFSNNEPNALIGTVKGPPILGIVDTGFSRTADHFPDIIFTWDTSIGGAGPDNYHGTKVSSTAASPVNDNAGTAGSSIYARGSIVDRLDSSADMGLLWAELKDLSLWYMGHTIIAAFAGGADVVNMSVSDDCNFVCRNFGFQSGWNSLADALEFADDNHRVLVVTAGNQKKDLADIYLIPCEMADHTPICVGGIDRSSQNVYNFGSHVDVWGPATEVWVSQTPGTTGPQRVSGTSFASPFVAGVVAMAIGAAGRKLTNSEVRSALRSTATTSSDPKAPRILNAYEFLRKFVTVRKDGFEFNNSWDNAREIGTEPKLLSTGNAFGYLPEPDVDWYQFPNNSVCSSMQFDVRFIPDSGTGDVEASVEYSGWRTGTVVADDVRRFAFSTVGDWSWPTNQRVLGVRMQGSLPTGYSIFNMSITPNPYSGGEGPLYPATCNGRDDDCDGLVDEGFPDSDGDGIADCVDPDDDNDCYLDTSDNCRTVPNGHQYCSTADNPERFHTSGQIGCGERCKVEPEITNLGFAIEDCFNAFPPEPRCYTDGCPWPGPMIHPEVAKVVASSLQLRNLLRENEPSYEKYRTQFGVIDRFQVKPDGRLVIPSEMQSDASKSRSTLPPAKPDPESARAQIQEIEKSPYCKPIFTHTINVIGALQSKQKCADTIRAKPCQVDSNHDGVGDACQTP